MEINKEEKGLIKTHLGIFEKIRSFLKKLFYKQESEQNKITPIEERNSFKESIQINEDKEVIRILELQHEFKKGNIDESEIEEDDYNKLIKLYDEQNEKLEQEIERYRIETAKIIRQMKKI